MPEITRIPFVPDHLHQVVLRRWGLCGARLESETGRYFRQYGGAGYTYVRDGKILGIGVITRIPPDLVEQSSGVASIYISDESERMPIWMVKTARAEIREIARELGISKVYATFPEEWEHWAAVVGFQKVRSVPDPMGEFATIMLCEQEV